jgi:hypothetical protein
MPTRHAARLAWAAIRGFLRDTDELSQHACGRTLLAHLQALETLQIAFRPPHRFKFGTPFAVDRQKTGVKTHRIGRGVGVIPQAQSGRPDGLKVALGGFQAREAPQRTKLLALRCRHGLALRMVAECQAPTGAQ